MADNKPDDKKANNANTPPGDQLAQSFGEMVTQWERNFDAFANQVMGTEAYSQTMNEMQKAQLGAQRTVTQNMSQQMAALNIATRDDIMQLTDLVQQLHQRMEKIEDLLSKGKKNSPKRKRPPRTKQPPTSESDSTHSQAAADQSKAAKDGAN